MRSPGGFGGGADQIGDHHDHANESGSPSDPISPALAEYLAALHATQAPAPTPATPTPTPAPTPTPQGRRGGGAPPAYPASLMGVVAHLRQAMLDAENHHARLDYYETTGGAKPATDPALDALYAARTKVMPVWWEANTRDEIHRALDLSAEFGTNAVIVGGREANKVADRLKALNVPVVLKLDFPDEPKIPTELEYRKKPVEERDDALKVLAEKNARWKERVAVAKTLQDAGVRFAFEAEGAGNNAANFPSQLRKVIAAGLPIDAAVAAMTKGAAEIAGVGKRLGTIEKGKLGHLVVLSGPVGEEDTKVKYVLVDGIKFDLAKAEAAAAAKKGTGAGTEGKTAKKGRGARGDLAKTASKKEDDESKDEPKKADETPKTDDAKIAEAKVAEAVESPKAAPRPDPTSARTEEDKGPETPFVDLATEFDADRKPTIQTGGNVLIKDATILTVTKGTIPKGSILIKDGKIAAVGTDFTIPEGVTVIDATGMVAMPGIIDTHSHQAIQGGRERGHALGCSRGPRQGCGHRR